MSMYIINQVTVATLRQLAAMAPRSIVVVERLVGAEGLEPPTPSL
jgi:hypothetical protein